MSHYQLDVDPDVVEQAATRLRRSSAALERSRRRASRAATGWAADWRGDTATVAEVEIDAVAGLLSEGEAALDGAARSLDRLAEDYRQAVDVELPVLERRREAALAAAERAEAAARRAFGDQLGEVPSGLRHEVLPAATDERDRRLAAAEGGLVDALRAVDADYDALVDRLRERTRTTGGALAADPPVPVPALTVLAYQLPGPLGAWLGPDAGQALSGVLPLADLVDRLADPPTDLAELATLLDQARAAGLPPSSYSRALEEHWIASALDAAGIDPLSWDPALGAQANLETIEAVYAYYGQLYLDDPDLEWAGMAAMIGPSFAGGFLDLALLRRLADEVPEVLRAQLPPGAELLGDLTAADIAFYETTLLQMQKDIFLDQGMQHQAYLEGGVAAVQELVDAGVLSQRSLQAWQDIASGDPDRVADGNHYHLYREQYDVIADAYDSMRGHAPTGVPVTWGMTFAGSPSIPGAQSFPDVFPYTVEQQSPGPQRIPLIGWDNPLQVTVEVETPFPAGNISDRDQRWALIEQDTLPAFRRLIEDQPDEVERLLQQPIDERIHEFRLSERWPHLVAQLADWDVEVRQ